MRLTDRLWELGFPDFIDDELVFPLRADCQVCHKPLEVSDRVFKSCPEHRFRRDGGFSSSPSNRPDGRTRP